MSGPSGLSDAKFKLADPFRIREKHFYCYSATVIFKFFTLGPERLLVLINNHSWLNIIIAAWYLQFFLVTMLPSSCCFLSVIGSEPLPIAEVVHQRNKNLDSVIFRPPAE